MTISKLAVAAAALALLPISASALTPQTPAKVLAGLSPGAPRDCLSAFEHDRESQLFADGSILYRGRSGTWFLNHPDSCPAFRSDSAIVSRTPSDQLCRGDILQVVQPTSGIFYGSCALGSFTAYERPASK